MEQIFKIYLKTLWPYITLVTTTSVIGELCFSGRSISVRQLSLVITTGTLFALTLTVAHVWGAWRAARASRSGDKKIDFDVRQTLEINVEKSPKQIFEQLRDALQPQKWHLLEFDKEAGQIICETSPIMTNGEKVTIQVEPVAEKQSKVRAVSEPVYLVNFFKSPIDFGRNKRNINLIENILAA